MTKLIKIYENLKKLSNMYREGVLIERQYQNMFVKYHSGNMDIADASRSGWPLVVDVDKCNV